MKNDFFFDNKSFKNYQIENSKNNIYEETTKG